MTTRICENCVGDAFLKDEVRTGGRQGRCHYCSGTGKTITLEALSDRIDEVTRDHFMLTSSEPEGIDYALAKEGLWERAGDPVAYVIADIAGLDEQPAQDVREILSDRYGHNAVKDGGEDPYADDAMYEEPSPDDWEFRESWNGFRSEIRSHARFFSKYARQALDGIFGEMATLRSWKGKPVIREMSPTDPDRYLYRARKALSETELIEILKDPPRGLGPPPPRNAAAGRMNASGIPVFYGAIDEETCLAEARAPVGSHVVVGRFEVIRPLRLLDFDVLTDLYAGGSHFDPAYKSRESRVAFLRRLVGEISLPVMPGDEEFEYLPTQAVAEYLGGCIEPRIDGIIFHSSQTAGEGRNIVLFNHACGIEEYDFPEGTESDFSMGSRDEDEYDNSIAIFETVPAKEMEPENPTAHSRLRSLLEPGAGIVSLPKDDLDEAPGRYNPALRLDIDGIRVLKVQRVKYDTRPRPISRYRKTKGEKEPF